MANLRKFLDFQGDYGSICREERNLTAIFYHLLMNKDNLAKFLNLIGCCLPIVEHELAIYFEYAFLRDLWFTKMGGDGNYDKRQFILDSLCLSTDNELRNSSILDFNMHFGAVPVPSRDYIQSPGNWSISRFKNTFTDNEEFLRICEFKWAFNAKPDIVIHLSKDNAICIEAKLESEEGYYPSNPKEILEFSKRNIARVPQTRIQKKIFEELLGINTEYIFLIQKAKAASETHQTLLWKNALSLLDLSDSPIFVKKWISKIQLN